MIKAIEDSQPRTEAEKSKRASNIKRFFKFICLPQAEDGLGFSTNPAASLEYLGLQRLQRLRRNANGDVAIFPEPEKVLPLLDIYWRTLLGVMVYGGLRLAETAALTWGRIDFKRRIMVANTTGTQRKAAGAESLGADGTYMAAGEGFEPPRPLRA